MENQKQGDNMAILKIAQKNFEKWNEALQTKDPKKVTELYAGDNTFLPTLSPDFKMGIEGAESYFVHFLEKDPIGEIKEEKVQALGEDYYVHSGMYDFKVGSEKERTIVNARFTYIWRKELNGEWKIIHHHSSLKPSA